MYFSSFLLQCIFQLLPFPMHTFYFDILLCSGFFFTPRERLISLRSILAFVVKRNWYFMAMLIWPKVAKGEGSGKMAHSIRFSKFMARVSVRYVPLYFFCVIYMNTLSGDFQFFLFFFFLFRFDSYLWMGHCLSRTRKASQTQSTHGQLQCAFRCSSFDLKPFAVCKWISLLALVFAFITALLVI